MEAARQGRRDAFDGHPSRFSASLDPPSRLSQGNIFSSLTTYLRNYFLIVFILVISPEQIVEGYVAIVNVNPRLPASAGIDASPNLLASLAFPYGAEPHILGMAWRFFATLTSPDVPHAVSSDKWIYEALSEWPIAISAPRRDLISL